MNIYVVLFVLIALILYVYINDIQFFRKVVYPTYDKVLGNTIQKYFALNNCANIHCKDNTLSQDLSHTQDKKIIFCGIGTKNEHLIKNIRMCEELGNYFKEYKIILSNNYPMKTVLKTINNPNLIILESRESSLSSLRNRYIEHIKNNYSEYEYVCVMDFSAKGYMNLDGFMSNFRIKENWDAIVCNGLKGVLNRMIMYDDKSFVPVDEKTSDEVWEEMQKIKSVSGYVRVKSGFNGACLYKLSSIIDKNYYDGYPSEHISLHLKLATILLNPSWRLYM